MKKTVRFVIRICSKFIPLDSKHLTRFTREQIEEIIHGLLDVLANHNPEVKPKGDFKEKHPHYRNFFADPSLPLKAPLIKTRPNLSTYQSASGGHVRTVPRNSSYLFPGQLFR